MKSGTATIQRQLDGTVEIYWPTTGGSVHGTLAGDLVTNTEDGATRRVVGLPGDWNGDEVECEIEMAKERVDIADIEARSRATEDRLEKMGFFE